MVLKNKDCAKILYNLYKREFCRLNIPIDVTREKRKRYSSSFVTDEEISMYSSQVMYISDEYFDNYLDIIRERSVEKKPFFLMVIKPTYEIAKKPKETIYVEDLEKFAKENKLLEGLDATFLQNPVDPIQVEEAERIVENIKSFLCNC